MAPLPPKPESAIDFCYEHGIEAEQLDTLVHDTTSLMASNVNNAGVESQIQFLEAQLGPENVLRYLRKLAKIGDTDSGEESQEGREEGQQA